MRGGRDALQMGEEKTMEDMGDDSHTDLALVGVGMVGWLESGDAPQFVKL